jgi:hypothetical protein
LQARIIHRFRTWKRHVNGARATTVACIKHANFLHISGPLSRRAQPRHRPLFMRDEVIFSAVKRWPKCQIQ